MKTYRVVIVAETFSVVQCEDGEKDKWLPAGFATEKAAREWIIGRLRREDEKAARPAEH